MKKCVFILSICLSFSGATRAQDLPNEAIRLNQELTRLYQEGKLDEGISVASQIVKLQRVDRAAKPQNLVNALENLSRLELTRFRLDSAKLSSGNPDYSDAKALFERMQKDAAEAEENLREALRSTGTDVKSINEQTVEMQNSLAWLLYNYQPPSPNVSIGFDKQTRDKFDSVSRTRFYKRIDEAESLYHSSMKASTAIGDGDGDVALHSLFELAEFELAVGKVEEALAHYEGCIARTEKKFGKTSKNLLMPLESYQKALIATDQDDAAFEVLSKIVRITGKTAQMPKVMLNLSLRSERAFDSHNAPSVEEKARANKESVELRTREAITAPGTTGVAFGRQVQASSTAGQLYYSKAGAIKLRRIPVRVVIDESGKVIEAEGLTSDNENKAEVERIIKGWLFRPFKLNGQARKIKGYVECVLLAEQF